MKLRRLRIWGIKDGTRNYADQQGPTLLLDPEVPEIRAAHDIRAAFSRYVDEVIDVWEGPWDSDERMQKWADAWNAHRESRERPVKQSTEEARDGYNRALERTKTGSDRNVWPGAEEFYEDRLALPEEALEAVLQTEYDHALESHNRPHTIETQREVEYDIFIRLNEGPPYHWDSLIANLDPEGAVGYAGQLGTAALTYDQLKPSDVRKCRECLEACEWGWHSFFPGPMCGSAGWVAFCRRCRTWHKEQTCIIS